MLPDSAVLKSMVDDATQGEWGYDPAKEYRPGVNGARNISGPQEGIFSYGGSVTIAVTGPSDDPQSMADAALIALAPALAAEVIRLRERLVAVEGERDEAQRHLDASRRLYSVACDDERAARAEVGRLREQVNPSTPEGKLNQWKAAEELRKNRPKAATAWEPTERKGWWMRRDVHGVGIAFAGDCGDFFADTSGRESSGEPSLEAAKKAADEALKAAGWELVE